MGDNVEHGPGTTALLLARLHPNFLMVPRRALRGSLEIESPFLRYYHVTEPRSALV